MCPCNLQLGTSCSKQAILIRVNTIKPSHIQHWYHNAVYDSERHLLLNLEEDSKFRIMYLNIQGFCTNAMTHYETGLYSQPTVTLDTTEEISVYNSIEADHDA